MPHEWSHGQFYWNEADDARWPRRRKNSMPHTLGWTFEAMSMPDGTYWVAKMGDKFVGGLFPLSQPAVRRCPGRLDVLSRRRRCRCTREEGPDRRSHA
mgnify:CR=1 FL=1